MEQEFDHRAAARARRHGPAVLLVGGQRLEHRHRPDVVVGVGIARGVRQRALGPDREEPAREVGALEVLADPCQGHRRVAAHGSPQRAVDPLAVADRPPEPSHPPVAPPHRTAVLAQAQPQPVGQLPGLPGDRRAGRSQPLPEVRDGGEDAGRVGGRAQQELHDLGLGRLALGGRVLPDPGEGRVALCEVPFDPGHGQEWGPSHVLADRQVEVGVAMDQHDAGHVLGPFQVPPGPIERFGRSSEQGLGHHGCVLLHRRLNTISLLGHFHPGRCRVARLLADPGRGLRWVLGDAPGGRLGHLRVRDRAVHHPGVLAPAAL